jgi:hypothetical protein
MTLLRGQVLLGADGALEQKPGSGQFLVEAPPAAPVR